MVFIVNHAPFFFPVLSDEADGNNAVRPRVPAPRAEGAAIPARAAARRRGGRNRLAAGRQDSGNHLLSECHYENFINL